jgi:hypothetical protein
MLDAVQSVPDQINAYAYFPLLPELASRHLLDLKRDGCITSEHVQLQSSYL